jgi:hypothetical protein
VQPWKVSVHSAIEWLCLFGDSQPVPLHTHTLNTQPPSPPRAAPRPPCTATRTTLCGDTMPTPPYTPTHPPLFADTMLTTSTTTTTPTCRMTTPTTTWT